MEPRESFRDVENLRFRFQMNNRLRLECLAAVSKVFRDFEEPIADDLLASIVFALPQELLTANGNGKIHASGYQETPKPPEGPQPKPPEGPQPKPPEGPQPKPPENPQPKPPENPQPKPPENPQPKPPESPQKPPEGPPQKPPERPPQKPPESPKIKAASI